MHRGRRTSGIFGAASLVLAVLSLVVRIAVPSGTMVSADQAGTGLPPLVICTANGAMTVAVDAAGHPAGGDHQDDPGSSNGGDHACAFAAAAVTFAPPVLADLAAPPAGDEATLAPLPISQRPGLGLAAPPPPTTGPPSII